MNPISSSSSSFLNETNIGHVLSQFWFLGFYSFLWKKQRYFYNELEENLLEMTDSQKKCCNNYWMKWEGNKNFKATKEIVIFSGFFFAWFPG